MNQFADEDGKEMQVGAYGESGRIDTKNRAVQFHHKKTDRQKPIRFLVASTSAN